VAAASPRVDVIIPTRNRPSLTIEAVDSVRGQTFDDWHLWVVDDDSDDDTVARLEDHLAGDPRVTVVARTSRGGANPARQAAFECGTAPLVATCDSDDLWAPEKLARQVAAYDLHARRRRHVGPVLCWHRAVDLQGHQLGVVLRPRLRRWWHPFTQFNTSTPLIPRSLLESAGGFASTDPYRWNTTDHLDLFLRLTHNSSLLVVPDVLVWCRHHDGVRNSDRERTLEAADEAASLVDHFAADLSHRPAASAWLQAAVAGRYLEIGAHRQALIHGRQALRTADLVTSAAIAAHYGPWAARVATRHLLTPTTT